MCLGYCHSNKRGTTSDRYYLTQSITSQKLMNLKYVCPSNAADNLLLAYIKIREYLYKSLNYIKHLGLSFVPTFKLFTCVDTEALRLWMTHGGLSLDLVRFHHISLYLVLVYTGPV